MDTKPMISPADAQAIATGTTLRELSSSASTTSRGVSRVRRDTNDTAKTSAIPQVAAYPTE